MNETHKIMFRTLCGSEYYYYAKTLVIMRGRDGGF